MKKYGKILLATLFVLLFVATGVVVAADATTATTPIPELRQAAMEKMEQIIQKREDNQAGRITRGYENGKLTDAEKAKLESQLAKINENFQRMKATEPGLTPKEFGKLQRQLDRNSAAIYRLNHNKVKPEKVVTP